VAQGAIFTLAAHGQVYEQRGTVLYEKIPVSTPYNYYYCGRYYTTYQTTYQYKEVLNYQKPDWRQQALSLIDKQKERESYESVLSMLGVQGLMAPKQQFVPQQQQYGQEAAFYPSATGNVLGGFTKYEAAQYGPVAPYDVNRADERIQAGADSVLRMTAEINATANNAAQQAISIQRLNSERVGALAEWQEMRALMRERAMADKDKALAETEKLRAEADLMRAMKPPSSSSVKYEKGTSVGVGVGVSVQSGNGGGGEAPVSPADPPPPPQPPVENGPHPGLALAVKFCADCHGGGKKNPAGGFYLDEGVRMNRQSFASLKLRLDPEAPDYKLDQNGQVLKDQDGHPIPYRMPPPSDDDPPPSREQAALIVQFAETLVVDQSRR
jgi:hypothetical protein